jgi:hypothetical protein
MNDHDLLLEIQALLDGVEWNSETLDRIAALMIDSCYRIRDCNDVDQTVEG